jgi:hypothetical protein
MDKLISRLSTKLSTHEATPIKNKTALSYHNPNLIKKPPLNPLRNSRQEEGGGNLKPGEEEKNEIRVPLEQLDTERLKILKEGAPKGSIWAKFYEKLGI